MRFLLIMILLLSLCGSTASQTGGGATGRGTAAASSTAAGSALELTTSIAEQKYCPAGGMLLILRLSYKNMGGGNLVLFRYGLAPHQHLISRSAEAAAAKHYEQAVNPMMGFSSGDIRFGDEPPPSYFVVLKPGESYSPVNRITVPVFIRNETEADCRPGEGDCEKGLEPGEYVLQVKVGTWPFRAAPEVELRSHWTKYGDIWAKPLLSLPMPFHVSTAPYPALSNCNAP